MNTDRATHTEYIQQHKHNVQMHSVTQFNLFIFYTRLGKTCWRYANTVSVTGHHLEYIVLFFLANVRNISSFWMCCEVMNAYLSFVISTQQIQNISNIINQTLQCKAKTIFFCMLVHVLSTKYWEGQITRYDIMTNVNSTQLSKHMNFNSYNQNYFECHTNFSKSWVSVNILSAYN